MRVAVIGTGAVGARAARQLVSSDGLERLVLHDPEPGRTEDVLAALADDRAEAGRAPFDAADADGIDVAVLASPNASHGAVAGALVAAGVHVVSVADGIETVRELLALDTVAREAGIHVVVGATFAPGLSCLLAAHAAIGLDQVDEVHVARSGTGGPACARQHHRALRSASLDWRDGDWARRRPGSGRELCWFPDPIGGEDCYRAALPDALLLRTVFPAATRVTARLAANRRDRLTARLPMMRRPHPEGGPGAVRVEVRGWRGGDTVVEVRGAIDRPALAAGAVAAVAALAAAGGHLLRTGAGGLADLGDPIPLLGDLARRGVKSAVFEGSNAQAG
ncbi:MAG: Gfo/Idh/MocA family oxidoreductase [Acidimicrobiia bacterium]